MGAPLAGAAAGLLPFWVSHGSLITFQFLPDFHERRPAIVYSHIITAALSLIQIGATGGAQAPAVGSTEHFRRYCQLDAVDQEAGDIHFALTGRRYDQFLLLRGQFGPLRCQQPEGELTLYRLWGCSQRGNTG